MVRVKKWVKRYCVEGHYRVVKRGKRNNAGVPKMPKALKTAIKKGHVAIRKPSKPIGKTVPKPIPLVLPPPIAAPVRRRVVPVVLSSGVKLPPPLPAFNQPSGPVFKSKEERKQEFDSMIGNIEQKYGSMTEEEADQIINSESQVAGGGKRRRRS